MVPSPKAAMHPGRLNDVRSVIETVRLIDFSRDLGELAGRILKVFPDYYQGDFLGQIITTVCVPNLLDLVAQLPLCHENCDALCFLRKGAVVSVAFQMIRDTE